MYTLLPLSLIVLLVVVNGNVCNQCGPYIVPQPRIEVLQPCGFRVSIEDSPGVTLFAFHGNINKEIPNLDSGTFSKDIIRKTPDGRWTFEETTTGVKYGDIIYYWLFVIKDGLGYRYDNGKFVVTELNTTNKNMDELISNIFQGPEFTTTFPNTHTTSEPSSTPEPTISPMLTEKLKKCQEENLQLIMSYETLNGKAKNLEEERNQLLTLYDKTPDAKLLTIKGRFIPDQDVFETVRYLLRNLLQLQPEIVWAQKKESNQIDFEVSNLTEKLEILKRAKNALRSSNVTIT